MKTFYLGLFLLVTTAAQASDPSFTCTVSKNDEPAESIELQRIGQTFSFWEGSHLRKDFDGNPMPSNHFIGIDYLPGIETVILRIREKDSDRMIVNRNEKARDGDYNLTIDSEEGGIFGQPTLFSFRIDCTLKNAVIVDELTRQIDEN